MQNNRKCVSGIEMSKPSLRLQNGARALRSLPQLALATFSILLVAMPAIIPASSAADAFEAREVESPAAGLGGDLSDAQTLARRIHLRETSALLVDAQRLDELASEIGQVLMHIRSRYPGMAEVSARPRYRPATLLLTVEGCLLDAIAQRWNGTDGVRQTGFQEFDELNSRLGLHRLESIPLLDSVIMHFSEHANLHAARQAYLAVDGVVSAEFDAYLGDGPDIAATKASGRWFVTMRKAWGDCPSGCLHSETSFFVVNHMRVERVERESAEDMVEFRSAVPHGDWPRWIE